ncbi:hypothetical protein TRFO_34574 [Tritrichomonas foetus]|uniref:Uncharacterized protein n=1 Tax=Tritrichomonas foetus TaxID=1144522 RepID=A0A1J4JIV9_9EUKA|nr:hypothetical protein TRFO_34574 [Tritrichomonas foetus]|eukprot:OHS99086.1 hypothetical protein TRFO_34574 [Tritrichomonas foetus]
MFPISTPHSSNIKVTSCHSINFISHKKGSKGLPVSLLTNGKMSSVNSSNDSLSNNNIDFNHKIKVSELFDTFIQKIRIQSIDESLEEMVNSLLNTVNSICYSINIKKRVFKHHLGNKEYSIGKSIIAYAYRTNQLVHVPNPTTHECFDSEGDSNCCTLYIPLSNYQNEVIKVIKVHPCQGISSLQTGKYDEKKLCELLMSKFKNYSHLINLDHNNAAKKDKFRFDKVISDIQSQFEARKVDFYLYDVHDRKYRKYDHTSKIFVDINSIGFASQVIEELRPFIYADITDSESYKEGDDGPVHETVIGSLIQFESEIGATILRGKISNSSIYTKNDANALNSYFPVLAKALGKKIKVLHVDTSVQTDEVEQKLIDVHYKECDLSNELLKVLELYETVSLTHDLKTRLSMIVEKTKTLLNVDFCTLFILHRW